MNNKYTHLTKAMTFLVVISPLFLQYIFYLDFVLLPEYFLVLGLLIIIANRHIYIKHHAAIIVYALYLFFELLFFVVTDKSINPTLSVTTFLRFLFYVICVILICPKYFSIEIGVRVLYLVAIINALYGLSQYVIYSLFSMVLPWNLPYLQVHYGKLLINEQDYFFNEFGFRFSGLFSEPAHFSQYIGVALVFMIFYQGKGQYESIVTRFTLSLIFIAALLLSGSGTGFFVIALVLIFYLKNSLYGRNRVMALRIAGAILGSIALYLLGSSAQDFTVGLERISSVNEASSTYVRVFRPWEVYLDLSTLDKIFGIGYGNYAEYVRANGLMNVYESSRDIVWTNGAGVILVGGGIVALTLFSLYFVYLYINSKSFYKILVIFVYAHLFFSDLPLTLYYVLIMSFVVTAIASSTGGSVNLNLRSRS